MCSGDIRIITNFNSGVYLLLIDFPKDCLWRTDFQRDYLPLFLRQTDFQRHLDCQYRV